MASTFTLKSHSYGGRYIQVECSQAKDIANNRSPITWKISSIGGSVNYYTSSVSLSIGGTVVYNSGRVEWDTERFPAAKGSTSGTINIKHDDYGNKKIDVVLTVMIYDGVPRTQTEPWTLDSIPRQATITDYPKEFYSNGTPPTIKYSNPAGNNASVLEICIADKNGVIVPYRDLNKTATSYQFTAADMEILKGVTGKSAELRFVIYTKIGSADLWSEKPTKFTMVEDTTTKPTVSLSVALDNSSLPSKFDGLWIQGKSRADVSITTGLKYGASIKSVSTQIGGNTYSGASFKSGVIDKSGKVDIVATVKDSREFSGTDSEEINVLEYSKPLVIPIGSANAISCYRSDGNGNRVGGSTSLWIKAKRFYYNINGINRCALQWRRKLSTEAWNDSTHKWTDLISKDTTTDEYNALLPGIEFELKKSYTVQIRAIDDFGEYDRKEFDIPTQDVALHLGAGGKNVSVGTYCDYSEEYTFYSDWKAIFDKGIVGTLNNQYAEDVIAFAEACAVGITPFVTGASSTNLPPTGNYQYSVGVVHKRSNTQINVYITNYLTGAIAINTFYDGTGYGWLGWKYITPQ